MIYIIMAGGKYEHWQTPRQLTMINGETLLERTVRLLKECGIDDNCIFVSTNVSQIKDYGEENNRYKIKWHNNNWVVHRPGVSSGYWCDGFYLMNEPVTYLMGDVVFSKKAIETIINTPTDDIEFFASAPPFSQEYVKPYAEPFAFKVVNRGHLINAQYVCRRLADEGKFRRRPIAWEFWQVIKGTPINKIDYHNYTVINDYTCDIDVPKDVEKFKNIDLD